MELTDEELALIIEVVDAAKVTSEHRMLKFNLLAKLQSEVNARAISDMQEPPA